MSIHDIPTTYKYHEPVIAYAIEGIRNKWICDFYNPTARIMNVTSGDPGLMKRAPHVDPILKSLFVFNINVNIPAPFALILEKAGNGNVAATELIFLRTLAQMSRHFPRDATFTPTPFDWDSAWLLGPPVYAEEDLPFMRALNGEIDTEIMHELADYPDEYISFLDYSSYWVAKIWKTSCRSLRSAVYHAIRELGPHTLSAYRKIGHGQYIKSRDIETNTILKLKDEVDD